MSLDAKILREVLEATKVSLPQLAALLDVEPEELRVIEQGQLADPSLVSRFAGLLGVSVEELLSSKLGPVALLYRRVSGSAPTIGALADGGDALSVGRIVRALRLADQLDGRVGRARPPLPGWATYRRVADGSSAPHGAEALAEEVRAELDLGLEPIDSVWSLAAQLGVRCAAVTPDELSATFSGLSWRDPGPTLVVNLVGGAGAWWATRMTVAHELGHVLFDLPQLGVVLSSDRQGRLEELFHAVEQRANAFAANLLVPPEAVRRLAGGRSPLDPGLVRELSARFQVSTFVACDVLCHAMGAGRRDRNALHALVRGDRVLGVQHPDALPAPSPTEQLVASVQRAVRAGVLDPVRARVALDLPMHAPLPFEPSEPIFDLRQQVRAAALRHLHETDRSWLVPGDVRLRSGGGFEVELRAPAGVDQAVEPLLLGADLRAG